MAEKDKSPKRSKRNYKPSEEVRQPRREILLGIRGLIDDALERM